MALGALIAWAWIPAVQNPPKVEARACTLPDLPSKTLEILAEGRKDAIANGQILTLSGKLKGLFKRENATVEEYGLVERGGSSRAPILAT